MAALTGAAAVAAAPSVGGQAIGSQEFTFTTPGAEQPFVVPPDVCAVTISASGAGGGGEGEGAIGGRGGLAVATLGVTPGETLTVRVGEAGGDGQPFTIADQPGAPGGAPGGGDSGGGTFVGGGGGGFSDVRRGDGVLGLGAGGGGAGGGSQFEGGTPGGPGGAGGGTTGADGQAGNELFGASGGTGGSQTAGGVGGTGDEAPNGTGGSGLALLGGEGGAVVPAGDSGGGGGGGGWFGGGGGGSEDGLGGGGGGGSSFADPTATGVSLRTGEGAGAGEDGSVLIEWTAGTGPCAVEAVIRFTG
jgi:hypothetical protein